MYSKTVPKQASINCDWLNGGIELVNGNIYVILVFLQAIESVNLYTCTVKYYVEIC